MLLLQPFGSKQSIPFVCLIHLFVGRCSLVVKDLHEHFSAEEYSLVFVEVEPLCPTKNMGHCPNTLDVGRAHKVGQAAFRHWMFAITVHHLNHSGGMNNSGV